MVDLHFTRSHFLNEAYMDMDEVGYLQGGCEEVVLGDDVHKEVRRDFSELVVEHADEAKEELLARAHGLL